jgi:hypothetical protein
MIEQKISKRFGIVAAKLLSIHPHIVRRSEFIISLSESIIFSTSISLSTHSRIHTQCTIIFVLSAEIAVDGSSA